MYVIMEYGAECWDCYCHDDDDDDDDDGGDDSKNEQKLVMSRKC